VLWGISSFQTRHICRDSLSSGKIEHDLGVRESELDIFYIEFILLPILVHDRYELLMSELGLVLGSRGTVLFGWVHLLLNFSNFGHRRSFACVLGFRRLELFEFALQPFWCGRLRHN
jgi:hypothetical protein